MSARLAAALAQHVARTTTAVLPVAAAVFAGTVFFWGSPRFFGFGLMFRIGFVCFVEVQLCFDVYLSF